MKPSVGLQRLVGMVLIGLTLSACALSPRQQADLQRLNNDRDVMMANGNRDRR